MKKHNLLLVFILFLAFVLRFWQLGQTPPGLYQDETAIGYNAYSILETGKDEHNQSFPLYFKSFGDWKLPVYIYATIVPIKLFGLNEFAVRFPSALFGVLTILVFYFWVQQLTNNKDLALVASLLLAINPWHLHYTRATFEVSIALFFFVLGALFFHLSFTKVKTFAFPLGVISFLIAFYTYNLTRLLSPILLVIFLFFYRRNFSKISAKIWGVALFIAILFLLPFISTFFSGGGITSTKGTFLFTSAAIWAPLLEFRSYLVSLPLSFTSLFFNHLALSLWQYIVNIFSYFSVNFLFLTGSTHGNHGIGNFGQFYLFELPLMIFGVIKLIREKNRWLGLLLFWVAATIGVASLTREAPHATRSFFLIAPWEIFSAMGIFYLWDIFKQWKSDFKMAILMIALIFVGYNLLFYFTSYYFRFPIFYAKAWRAADKELSLYLQEKSQSYDKVIIDKSVGLIYTSLLFYQKYPPQEFQKTVVRSPDDPEGFSEVERFGKYEFRPADWTKDLNLTKTLLVTTPANLPPNMVPIKTISYPTRPVVLAIKEKIIQYPVTEVAYVLVESNPQR